MATQIPHAAGPSSNGKSPEHELFRTLVENVADPIFLIDLDTEQCIYVSPAIRALLGLDADALIGRPLTDFVHPDDRSKVVARSASRRRGKTPRNTVTRMSHHDGQWIWVQSTASPVLHVDGRPATVFTVTNASERVLAETGLRAARLRLRHLLSQINLMNEHFENPDGSYDLTVETLAAALELRDDETGQHTRRVADLAMALTRVLEPSLADDPELRYGFLLTTSARSASRTRSCSRRVRSRPVRWGSWRCIPRSESTYSRASRFCPRWRTTWSPTTMSGGTGAATRGV